MRKKRNGKAFVGQLGERRGKTKRIEEMQERK